MKSRCRLALVLLCTLTGRAVSADVLFEDVFPTAGIDYVGESWGLGWRDYNADGNPDVWMGNHQMASTLYVNHGDGSFDVEFQPFGRRRDTHGVGWGDLDNDGDPDLLELVGAGNGFGVGPNSLFINQGERFVDEARARGLDYPYGRGRFVLWLDYDNDGLLDVLVVNDARPDGMGPTALFANEAFSFRTVTSQAGLGGMDITGALLCDLSGDRKLDLLAFRRTNGPFQRVYRLDSTPFQLLTGPSPLPIDDLPYVVNATAGDFNGDLKTDILFVRSREVGDVRLVSERTVQFALPFNVDTTGGMEFDATGDVTFELSLPPVWDTSRVSIGAAGSHPHAPTFDLSANDPRTHGLRSSRTAEGIHVGYVDGRWILRLVGGESSGLFFARARAEAIANAAPIGFHQPLPPVDVLLLSDAFGGYRDATAHSMLDHGEWCRSAAAGDFDNDMDVDLYLVCSAPAANVHNKLFLNLGDGTFESVDAHGAEGARSGKGDAVAIADYDRDGFLDMLVSNGLWRLFAGPTQLFRNRGNDNHWLELDLQGTQSNRDAVGARVELTAGGISQLREQTGGGRFAAQDDRILHFGLRGNTRVEHIAVYWPSGEVQQLFDVEADQVLSIVEDTNNRDEDGDGLPDQWEYQHGLEPLDAADAASDGDGDGRTNAREFRDGTDPNFRDAAAHTILRIDAPATVPRVGVVRVTVHYETSVARDVLLALRSISGPWWGGRVIETVGSGKGELGVDFPMRFAPPAGEALQWVVRILPVGEDWPQTLARNTLKPVVVGAASYPMNSLDAAQRVHASGTLRTTVSSASR